ncbi:acyltransferase [Falsibacillus albus]|uniref:Acyltransferase n=1 Tax=Falsibacillus albus TaxID=2478915 RepID=A0A3L7K2T4_9BACI|nr:acyltransferase [Falsibacillus albus]RLQ96659.1 acyltransferase [Falsibacillus albus]
MEKLPTANTKKEKTYLFEIHFLRAFACLLVVGVHVSATNYFMNGEKYTWFTYFLNQIGRFGTPIFAVISGFLLFYQLRMRNNFDLGYFFKSRMAKVIIPFFIWSLVYRFLLYYYDHQAFGNFWPEAEKVITGNSFYHLYFVLIVAQFYLIFPLLQKVLRTQSLVLIFTVISFIISYNLYGFHPDIKGGLGAFLASKSFMPIWIAYFAFGAFLAYFWEGIVKYATSRPWRMLLLALIISAGAVVEYTMHGYVSNRRLTNLANIPLLSIAIIGTFPLLSKWNFIKQPMVLIGKYSMGIYLVHPLILYLMARHLPEPYWDTRAILVMFAAVMVIAMIFIRIIQFIPFSTFIIPVPKVKKMKRSGVKKQAPEPIKQSA